MQQTLASLVRTQVYTVYVPKIVHHIYIILLTIIYTILIKRHVPSAYENCKYDNNTIYN